MAPRVLVTEGDSPLSAALARLFVSKGCAVATTTSRTGGSGEREGGAFLSIPWNRRSPVSAHTVLLSALNALEDLDDAFILEAPVSLTSPLHEAASADIERAFDDAKGAVFMAREVLGYLLRRGSGVLCMVSFSPAGETPRVVTGLREGFRGFASSLLAGHPDPPPIVNGFQANGASPEEFAAFIDRTLEEKARRISGRWFTLQPRGGFFQGVLSTSVRRG